MIGQQVSKYAVIEEIGRGGMGVVYRAHDPDLRRDVALKVLAPNRTHDARRKRKFVQEARAASSLDHPGIVTVFDVVHHRGHGVIVMELVAGRSLRTELQRQPRLAWPRAVEVGLELADAMAAAHRRGIVHRDLKPENLKFSCDGRLKVLDFGLATLDPLVTPDPDDDAATWLSGVALSVDAGAGTVTYMAPEQALGESVGPPADIFAFGVILYEMVCGRRPFRGSSALATLQAIAFDRPKTVEPIEGLPPAVRSLIDACLEKKPINRPKTFDAVAQVLEELRQASLEIEGTSSRVGPARATRRAKTSARTQTLAAAAALASTVVALAWTWDPNADAANAPVPRLSDGATAERVGAPGPSAYAAVREARRLLVRYDRPGHLQRAMEILSETIEHHPRSALGFATISEAYWRHYRIENEDSMWLDRAESHARRALALDEHLAASHIALARVEVERGQIHAAEALLDRAAILEPLNPALPMVRGRAFEKGQDLDRAAKAYTRAIVLDADSREPLDSLGSLHFRRARYQRAEDLFRRSIAVAPDSYIGYRNLAGALQMQGRHAEAATQLQRSLEIRPSWRTYANLGTLQFFRGLFADAVSAYEQAIELGANSYLTWANLGDAYRFSSVYREKAPAAYRRALQLAKRRLTDLTTDVELRSRIALYHAKLGDTAAALDELGRIELDHADAALQVRAVVIFELAGKRPRAIETIRRVLAMGYPVAVIEDDPELEDLRRDNRYHQLFAQR